jgi:hypothetical protein
MLLYLSPTAHVKVVAQFLNNPPHPLYIQVAHHRTPDLFLLCRVRLSISRHLVKVLLPPRKPHLWLKPKLLDSKVRDEFVAVSRRNAKHTVPYRGIRLNTTKVEHHPWLRGQSEPLRHSAGLSQRVLDVAEEKHDASITHVELQCTSLEAEGQQGRVCVES